MALNMICCKFVPLGGGGGNCARTGLARNECSSTRPPADPIVRYDILNTYPLLLLVLGMFVVLKRKPTAPGDRCRPVPHCREATCTGVASGTKKKSPNLCCGSCRLE